MTQDDEISSLEGGEQFGHFRLVRHLARGGMAEVFVAFERRRAGVERQVVLKRILPELTKDIEFLTMFLDEARLATLLEHPHVARTFAYGEIGGQHYITMEYIDGIPTSDIIMNVLPDTIPLELTLRIVSDTLSGLHHAHDARGEEGEPLGVVHRDVSPQNILVSREGIAKIIDFGVARAATQIHVTGARKLKGKLAYMAPELLRKAEPDRRADIFAVGVVLHEMVTGQRLFRRSSEAGTVLAIRSDEPPDLQAFGAPAELQAIAANALDKDPRFRFKTALEMKLAVDALVVEDEHVSRRRLGELVAELISKIEDGDATSAPAEDTKLDSIDVAELPSSKSASAGRPARATEPSPPSESSSPEGSWPSSPSHEADVPSESDVDGPTMPFEAFEAAPPDVLSDDDETLTVPRGGPLARFDDDTPTAAETPGLRGAAALVGQVPPLTPSEASAPGRHEATGTGTEVRVRRSTRAIVMILACSVTFLVAGAFAVLVANVVGLGGGSGRDHSQAAEPSLGSIVVPDLVGPASGGDLVAPPARPLPRLVAPASPPPAPSSVPDAGASLRLPDGGLPNGMGLLSVDTVPATKVRIGGRKLGATPVVSQPLKEGVYHLRFRDAAGKGYVRRIFIKAGRSSSVEYDFRPPAER